MTHSARDRFRRSCRFALALSPRRPASRWPRVLAGIALLLLVSCERRGPLTIGVVLPFSGELGQGGGQLKRGMELATAPIRGQVEFVYRDDRGMPSTAAQWVLDLADRGVVAVVGGMSSSCALAEAARAEAIGVPLITTMATHADVARDREWVFRMSFSDPQQGQRMAEYAFDELHLRRVGILRNAANEYSVGLADAFAAVFLKRGGTIVDERLWRREYDDAEDLRRWLVEHPCEALYMPLYSRDVRDVLEKSATYRRSHPLLLLGGDGWHASELTNFFAQGESEPERIFVTAHFAADSGAPEVERFMAISARGDDIDVVPTSAAALGYDLGRVLCEVVATGARDRESVRQAIVECLTHFEGATGNIYLTPDREMTKEIPILTWTGTGWHATGSGR